MVLPKVITICSAYVLFINQLKNIYHSVAWICKEGLSVRSLKFASVLLDLVSGGQPALEGHFLSDPRMECPDNSKHFGLEG